MDKNKQKPEIVTNKSLEGIVDFHNIKYFNVVWKLNFTEKNILQRKTVIPIKY